MRLNSLFPFPIYLLDETGGEGDGGGGGEGAGGGNEGSGDDGNKDSGRLEALEKAVTLLAQGNSELNQGLAALVQKLESIPSRQEHKDTSNEEEPDLETMDRKQYTAWLMGQIKGTLQQEVKPLNERFSQLDEKIDGHTLGTMVERFVNDPKNPHPDFYEWKDEMRALVKENPTLTPARLYSLARIENRAKAAKMDEKYGLGPKPDKRNGEDRLLSLFPRSGSSATKGETGKMSPKEAAEKAWDQVMSSLG